MGLSMAKPCILLTQTPVLFCFASQGHLQRYLDDCIMNSHILFLTLETFSRTGGIQQVCRNLAKALEQVCARVMLFSVCDSDEDLLNKYLKKPYFRGFRRNKLAFVFHTLREARNHQILLLAHINLLPIAYLVKILYPRKRIIMLAHGIEVWKPLDSLQRYFLNKHTEIWAVSAFTKSKMIRDNHIEVSKINVLLNCLDPFFQAPKAFAKPAELLKRYELTNDQPVILSVCRLSQFERKKGYDLVIHAMPKLLQLYPSLRYYMVGAYDYLEKQRLEALIRKLGLAAHVHLLGVINEEELSSHYLLGDVFALPSQKEGFGLVLIEAAASGCMVVGGNQDGSLEALLGGEIGRLVDPKDADQLICTLCSCLSDLSRNHSPATQRQALNSFSYSTYKKNVQMLLS